MVVESPTNPIHKYFGYFEFVAGESYYLGSFVGRVRVGKDKPIIYTIEDPEVPDKIIKALRRRKLIEKGEEIIKTYPYQLDSLVIETKSRH